MYSWLEMDELNRLESKTERQYNRERLDLMKTKTITLKRLEKRNSQLFAQLEEEDNDFFLWVLALLKSLGIDVKKYDLNEFKENYNATTGFVYANEIARKRARYYEYLAGAGIAADAIKTNGSACGSALDAYNSAEVLSTQKSNARQWNVQRREVGIDLERDVTIQSWKDRGHKKVRWVTSGDERVCSSCGELHGKIFDIDKVPARPHRGCRCEIEPADKKKGG